MFRRKAGSIAAAALLAVGLGAVAAPSASALTVVDKIPHNNGMPQVQRSGFSVISPYGDRATCWEYRGTTGTCWQKRPDGKWVALAPALGLQVYPVWEDPASLANLLP